MTSFRIREYGSAEWTSVDLEGDLDSEIALALCSALRETENWHVQIQGAEGEWGDLAEVDLTRFGAQE